VVPARQNEAQKAKAILKGEQGGALVETQAGASSDSKRQADDTAEMGMAPPRNEREKKLFELRMKMNQSRSKNNKEVIEEQKRNSDPDYVKKQAELRHKRTLEETGGSKDDHGADDGSLTVKSGLLPKGKEYLNDTVETVEKQDAKKKKKSHGAFGWDVFNQESLYRAHDKRLKDVQFDEKAYSSQKEQVESGESSEMSAGFGFQPSEEGKARLQEAMEKMTAKKKEWSRRRTFIAEEDATYVNERNRHFNKKLERSFGAYTEETRQNLERGTAL